jgi:hypothetical protein
MHIQNVLYNGVNHIFSSYVRVYKLYVNYIGHARSHRIDFMFVCKDFE